MKWPDAKTLPWDLAVPVVAAQLPWVRPKIALPIFRGGTNSLKGCCYAASEALHHLIDEETHAYCCRVGDHKDQTHWFLRLASGPEAGRIIDVTASQFPADNFPRVWDQAVRKGFLTPGPSRRARLILSRITPEEYFRR